MKKIISILLLSIGSWVSAQVDFSAKANLVFPTGSSSWKDISTNVKNAYEQKGKNNIGFNVGLSAKIDLPSSLFIMPEIYYTTFENEITTPITHTTLKAQSNRLDVPVLIGANVIGKMLGIFVGPVASYNFSANKEDLNEQFKEVIKNDFTLGYQFGVQAKIKNFIFNARYEGAFSEDQRNFIKISNNNTYNIEYDNRPSLITLGLGYSF